MTETKKYEINFETGKLEEVKATVHSVPLGQVIQWGGNYGWAPENFVVVEHKESSFGNYLVMVSLKDKRFHNTEVRDLKFRDDKSLRHTQYMFVLDEVMSAEETQKLHKEAVLLKAKEEQARIDAEAEYERKVQEGKELFKKYAPEGTKSVIVAEYHVDESDSMVDYFHERQTQTVVLGFSKHNRDLFSEMRKHCHKFDAVKEMATAPDVDYNGEKKDEENKEWWTPADEHREKYSMGRGYYLKSKRGRGGWSVCKTGLSDDVYASLAETCLFGGEQ